ncbi:MAG: hypothetical protein Tsb009_21200 [Planctomycetaceae bacterium]
MIPEMNCSRIDHHTNFLAPQTLPVCFLVFCCAFGQSVAQEKKSPAIRHIKITDRLPYGLSPVNYSRKDTSDVITTLNRQLASGKVKLKYRGPNGYLKSVLKALDVPLESQLLVFSKTALNQHLVNPQNPRAIYFNDDVYVGWVPGATKLEISTTDPLKGTNFYTLFQSPAGKPQFVREESCLACHAGRTTLSVPGHMVRSFLVRKNGKPVSGYSRITHDSDYHKRWGGWYVTGIHGKLTHSGNVVGEKQNRNVRDFPGKQGNVTDLKRFFDVTRYLSPHSDIVAHMVFNHQAHGHNLITRVNFESRFHRKSDAESQLLRYLLFVDEPKLIAPVTGTSAFAKIFPRKGPRDKQGRSLRDFDLKTRLFKYRLSFLIQTKAFLGLPEDVKTRLYRQLWEILTGVNRSSDYRHLSNAERLAIRTILVETQPELPAYWYAGPSN